MTVDGKSDAVPELKKVMEDLDTEKVGDEIALIATIRKDYWKSREKQRKMVAELKRWEREVQRIEMHSAHIDGKISRLRSYARFIDGGWKDESALERKDSGENRKADDKITDQNNRNGESRGGHVKEEGRERKRELGGPSRSMDELGGPSRGMDEPVHRRPLSSDHSMQIS